MRNYAQGLSTYAVVHNASLAASILFAFAAIALYMTGHEHGLSLPVAVCFFAAVALAIVNQVFLCMILHRGWSSVQDGKAATTPGKAVGFLFIPLFTFYWHFVAWPGLMKEFSRRSLARGRGEVSNGLALAYAIVSLIPYVNMLVAPLLEVGLVWQVVGRVGEADAMEIKN